MALELLKKSARDKLAVRFLASDWLDVQDRAMVDDKIELEGTLGVTAVLDRLLDVIESDTDESKVLRVYFNRLIGQESRDYAWWGSDSAIAFRSVQQTRAVFAIELGAYSKRPPKGAFYFIRSPEGAIHPTFLLYMRRECGSPEKFEQDFSDFLLTDDDVLTRTDLKTEVSQILNDRFLKMFQPFVPFNLRRLPQMRA